LHVGRSVIVVESDLTEGDRRVAKVIQTQAVLTP
jgi:acyl-coenzyme A thioesterase PaaI-like protein